MNYIDKNIKIAFENKTIGIIIYKKNNKFYMEYCSDDRIIAREYKIVCYNSDGGKIFMSEHNSKTLEMYKSGGALEYIIQQNQIDPETEKWKRLFDYVENVLRKDKTKKILEFGSGTGTLAIMLQNAGYPVISTDVIDEFLDEQKRIGITNVKKFNFLSDNFDELFNDKFDLIISWRNPHLDMDDAKKLFDVVYNGLDDEGLFIVNFQNADVHPEAEILPNGTKYNYKILEDKQTKEERFFAYYTKSDIEELRRNLFEIEEYHNEGGSEKKNWHVLTLRKNK